MTFVERNQPVQTFPPDRPDDALTERVGLRRPYGRLQDAQPHRPDRAVDGWGVDRIAVVDQEAMRGLARDRPAGPPTNGNRCGGRKVDGSTSPRIVAARAQRSLP